MKLTDILLELLDEESQAAKDAKAMGLTYMGYGRWGKNGHVTHTSARGVLRKFTNHQFEPGRDREPTPSGGMGAQPSVGFKKSNGADDASHAAIKKAYDSLTKKYDKYGNHDDRYSGAWAAMQVLIKKKVKATDHERIKKILNAVADIKSKQDDRNDEITPDEWYQGLYDVMDKLAPPTPTKKKR